MYNIKLENYIPNPTPAMSDRIVAAHYYAAWKKGLQEYTRGLQNVIICQITALREIKALITIISPGKLPIFLNFAKTN